MVTPRGAMVEIGGRTLRAVRAGPSGEARAGAPLILLEHGAFGCATDWSVVQDRLASAGLRSIAYDRAGLGHSPPGPVPRDGRAIVADMHALLQAMGETGPVVLVGHSMGGLMVRLYAVTWPEQVLGVVLVDAVAPEIMKDPVRARGVHAYGRLLRAVAAIARLGLMRPVALAVGNRMGLEGGATVEKRRIYGAPGHAHWSAEEVAWWPATSDMVSAAELADSLPVAVVTAGSETVMPWLKALQVLPAHASRHGYVEHVRGAGHASLLGRRFAVPIVRGVEHVLAASAAGNPA
jgi:pimeloyl-ACP methyl ester carboxylesterase